MKRSPPSCPCSCAISRPSRPEEDSMADYHSPTVVQPDIPAADMTPLERLILDLISVGHRSWSWRLDLAASRCCAQREGPSCPSRAGRLVRGGLRLGGRRAGPPGAVHRIRTSLR